MDSVSQLVLGAAVSVTVMGRRMPVWKSALLGAVCGTLPDLDVFINHGDPVSNMTMHRTESHALFYLTLVSPLISWLGALLLRERGQVVRTWLAVWLALITHPLLDAMTVYGTQLGLPFTDYPYAVGSMFIIDPLYTLPLLVGTGVALILRSPRGLRWNRMGLLLSCLYLAWSVFAQYQATQAARQAIAQQYINGQRLLVTPTSLNTLVWRVVVMTPGTYGEGFYSLLDPDRPLEFTFHSRGEALYARNRDNPYVARMAWFTHGFFRLREQEGRLLLSDLRMGEEPYYTFTFDLGPLDDTSGEAAPARVESVRPPIGESLHRLWQRLKTE